ncbi:MAG: glycosyltransferase [Roseinatronobacter sp.]
MHVEVIVATYRSPAALGLTLATLEAQQGAEFDICVAEDAEDPETEAVIAATRSRHTLRHIRQRDAGFRKNRILNKAIASSTADYLIFVDGDCLLHPGFVARHLVCARPDRYMSGGLLRLSPALTRQIFDDPSPVQSGAIWQRPWQQEVGLRSKQRHFVKMFPERLGPALDKLPFVRKRWLGANASAFRAAICKVNGFDMSLDYGAEDKELGVRLENAGVRPFVTKYSTLALHLDHTRPYVTETRNVKNHALLAAHRASGETWSACGLAELEAAQTVPGDT